VQEGAEGKIATSDEMCSTMSAKLARAGRARDPPFFVKLFAVQLIGIRGCL
jgi:hypothetical protein